MIKIENTEVLGWEAAIRGLRNPMNSWAKSDSIFYHPLEQVGHDINENAYDNDDGDRDYPEWFDWKKFNNDYELAKTAFQLGPNDHKLMMNLAKAGSVDAKYRRMIVVYADITAPLYWWKEFDTYKVGTVSNSCSTMHKIHSKEFTLDDFSCEHLFKWPEEYNELPHFEADISYDEENVPTVLKYASEKEMDWHYDHGAYVSVEDYDSEGNTWIDTKYALDVLTETVEALNYYREKFLETQDKRFWWQMIQLLPSSYNQRRTIMMNYEVLAGIYPKRKEHKLDEWRDFCAWIEGLPYSELITLKEDSNG